MQNTNTYGHESRQRRPYNPANSYSSYSSSNQFKSRSYVEPARQEPTHENNFPSLNSFPSLGGIASGKAKVYPELQKNTGRFDALEEVIDISNNSKPAFSYSSMAAKVNEAPMKKIIEEKKVFKKSNKIDTKGKKVYMTQKQYLYDGHKYNAEDVVIVDDNGQELYFSDNDYDCNDSDSDNDSDNDDSNEAW